MTESKLSERFAALISFLSDKVPADELEDSADVADKILADIASYEYHPDAVAKAVEALESSAEAISYLRDRLGCSGPGDHKDRKADVTDSSSETALNQIRIALAALRARTASPSPAFDEDAERAAFCAHFRFGDDAVPFNPMWSGWLASARRRRV